MCRGGDFTARNGTSGESIFLRDENFGSALDQEYRRSLSPALTPTDLKSFICTVKTEWMDRKHVVFAKVVERMDVVEAIENVGSSSGRISKPVVIANWDQA
ncbi:hypothetical protein K1719_038612 [Acacia pycnantha]|nr:hypothetical protein K1719_038612 [Acacia pycnantha]